VQVETPRIGGGTIARHRRTLFWILAGLIVVALAWRMFSLWDWHEITRDSYDRIREGMTLSEAERLLGPPGDFRTGGFEADDSNGPSFQWQGYGPPRTSPEGLRDVVWQSDSGWLSLQIDDSNKIQGKSFLATKKVGTHGVGELFRMAKRYVQKLFFIAAIAECAEEELQPQPSPILPSLRKTPV
jgi:hypothetical protein